MDWAAEGLLAGLRGDERAARADLLDQLHAGGVGIEDLRRAVAEDRLSLLPVELALGREGSYTVGELAERAGVDVEYLERERRALGLPVPDRDARAYDEEDLEAARRSARFLAAGFPPEATLQVLRVVGAAMAGVAEAMRAAAAVAAARPGDTERDLALRLAELAEFAAPTWGPMLGHVLHEHLREQVRGDVITRAEAVSGQVLPGAQDVAVAFADLVGFTRLGERRPADELGSVAERLAELAAGVAEPPVRLVKTIGDAAMLVSPEPGPLLDAALALVDAAEHEGEDFPQLRAGAAWGPALNRAGDWYGHTVNLASRLTGIARPGSVLATGELRDRVRDGYRWSYAGERRLRSVRRPVRLFRARAPEPDAAAG